MPHIQSKTSHVSPTSSASPNPKVNRANPKVNRAKNQYRASGILCALAHGKLYFEALKMFSVPQNDLPRKRGRKHSAVMFSGAKSSILLMLIKSHRF